MAALGSVRVAAQGSGAAALVTQAVDVHRLARAEFDRGAAPLDLKMDRMLLVLKRGEEQEAALRKLLDDQQDKNSRSYRQWLTPEQFGQQFGPADSDIQKITAWLLGHGFHDVKVSHGRTTIEFSGNAAQVQEALGTSIHKFVVNGEEHWANANDSANPGGVGSGGGGRIHTAQFSEAAAGAARGGNIYGGGAKAWRAAAIYVEHGPACVDARGLLHHLQLWGAAAADQRVNCCSG